MMFVWGVLATMAAGLLLALVFDEDTRDAVLTLGWAMLIGTPLMLFLGLTWVLRHILPTRLWPRMIRGRTLSARALGRVADQAAHQGWMVSRPGTSVIVLRRSR